MIYVVFIDAYSKGEMIQKAALAKNDPDQLQGALAEFLRPDITFIRTKENYFDKVLPLILEIRSRNEEIIVRPLTSFRQ